ncbi:MAG TPA: hypothetical protein VF089_11325, partial [Candidatus Binatia bacterium]
KMPTANLNDVQIFYEDSGESEGAEDDANRGGSTPVATARRLAELVPGSELALVPNVAYDILGRWRRADCVKKFFAAPSDSLAIER